MFNESGNLDARAKEQFVIHMSESVDVHFTIAETTWICQEWAEIRAFPGESQHGATVSVLCDIHTALCAVSKPQLHTVLILVVLQTILGQCRRAGMLCARQLIAIAM